MLLRLKVKNFLSFYEETTFDMFPNLKRTTFENHIYRDMEIPLLKQAAIYGANGSGKSNLLEVLKFIKSFATKKDYLNKKLILDSKFKLAENTNTKSIYISIEFFHNEIYFVYEVDINDDGIKKEELYVSGIGKIDNKLIYSRNFDKYNPSTSISEDVNNATNQLIKLNPLSSLLSLNSEFPIINDDNVKIAYDWFFKQLEILSLRRVNKGLLSMMSKDLDFLEFSNKIIREIGLGIEELKVEQIDLNEVFLDESENSNQLKEKLDNRLKKGNLAQLKDDRVLFSVETENEIKVIKRFIFKQIGINGYIGEMEYEAQSDGTARILNLIPALYYIKNEQCVYLIDEIENSIHPTLMIALLKFFSETNTKGQLIFTTHETELLNQKELMRPDEVWFTEKKNGNTHLYSLNDFKEHNTLNIKNGYLEGRYGAIPFIGNLNE